MEATAAAEKLGANVTAAVRTLASDAHGFQTPSTTYVPTATSDLRRTTGIANDTYNGFRALRSPESCRND